MTVQNESERTNAHVDGGEVKWQYYYKLLDGKLKEEVEVMTIEEIPKEEFNDCKERNAWRESEDVVSCVHIEPGPAVYIVYENCVCCKQFEVQLIGLF